MRKYLWSGDDFIYYNFNNTLLTDIGCGHNSNAYIICDGKRYINTTQKQYKYNIFVKTTARQTGYTNANGSVNIW